MKAGPLATALDAHGYLLAALFLVQQVSVQATTLNDDRPHFVEPIPNITVAAGRDVILPCVIENLGDNKVAWIHREKHALLTLHDRVITRNTRYSISHNGLRTWMLGIRHIEESEKGEYMCQINTSPMMSQSGFLEVFVPPKINEDTTSSDTEVREGNDVSLRCEASGLPAPDIKWRKEDQKDTHPGGKINSNMTGELLNISKVSRLHMGAYLCIASNGVPPSVSKRIMLNVLFAPMVWIPNQLVGAPLDSEVVLDCGLESFPQSVTYWKKEGGPILLTNAKYESLIQDRGSYKSQMQLRIRDLQPEDYGSYTCVAKNSLGETEGTIKLYEIPRPTTTSTAAPTYKTSKTEGTQRTTSEKMPVGPWQNSLAKENTESARKAELSTELLEKPSTLDGIAAAAAADRNQGTASKESRRRLTTDGQSSSGTPSFSVFLKGLQLCLLTTTLFLHFL